MHIISSIKSNMYLLILVSEFLALPFRDKIIGRWAEIGDDLGPGDG